MKTLIDKTKMKELQGKGYFTYIAALISVFVLPIHVKYLPPFMILWVICWIFENYKQLNKLWDTGSSNKTLFGIFIAFYLWQAVSLFYSVDLRLGYGNLFSRLSLILFPLVLTFPGEMIKQNIIKLLRVFAVGAFLFMLFCFANALYTSVNFQDGNLAFNFHPKEYPWQNYFFWNLLVISRHPSYISMYLVLAAIVCFESWFDTALKTSEKIFWLMVGGFLLIAQYFVSSKVGIIISLFLVPVYFLIKFRELGRYRFAWIWFVLILVAVSPIILKNQRIDYLYGSVLNKQIDYVRKQDPRILIWKSAIKLAGKNLLFGQGIGDARTELSKEYERIGEFEMAKEKLNAHDQFLEVLLENGIIGLILFLSIFVYMTYLALSRRNILLAAFIIMMIIFFMFESMLNRLAGVTFFALFSFLLLYLKPSVTSFAHIKQE